MTSDKRSSATPISFRTLLEMTFGSAGPLWFSTFIAAVGATLRARGALLPGGALLGSFTITNSVVLLFSSGNRHPRLALAVIRNAIGLTPLVPLATPGMCPCLYAYRA